jgi:carboxymethylenebutenolidase
LIPQTDQAAIKNALKKEDPNGSRMSYVEIEDADHGFMCEQRGSFNPKASTLGWQLLMNELS